MPQKIHALTIAYNGLSNILQSKAEIGIAFDPNKTSPNKLSEFEAIWDTGASATAISENVVKQCGLKPTGIVKVETAGGTRNHYTYLISLRLPNGVGFPTLKVTEGQLNGTDILIGMDVIGQGDFSVSNFQGKTVFSYRIPSITKVDFVNDSKLNSPKVGRNNPCPCGSRKKYKKCCGKS